MVPSDLNPAAEAKGDKDKALKNDEVFGCARSVHFRDLENHHSEYHPLNYDSVVQVGPPDLIIKSGESLKCLFRRFFFYTNDNWNKRTIIVIYER